MSKVDKSPFVQNDGDADGFQGWAEQSGFSITAKKSMVDIDDYKEFATPYNGKTADQNTETTTLSLNADPKYKNKISANKYNYDGPPDIASDPKGTVSIKTDTKGTVTITNTHPEDAAAHPDQAIASFTSQPIEQAQVNAMQACLKEGLTLDEAAKLESAGRMLIGAVKDGKFDEGQTQNIVKAYNAAAPDATKGASR